MSRQRLNSNRRTRRGLFVHAAVGVGSASGLATAGFGNFEHVTGNRLPIAAVVTAYHKGSHADVTVGKILEGYDQAGGAGPDLEIVSLYTDQVPKNDMSRAKAAKHGFRISPSIDDALTLGTNKLQVSGVLSIGEHGDYPKLPGTGQHMYPRRRFFDDITATFRRVGQVAPIFNDKHLAYRWEDAKAMYDTAANMKIQLMAGSSLPLAWRLPQLELPRNCEIEDALAIGYGGTEAYGFHALEMLQCMIERRRGGESGVKSLRAVSADGILPAADAGEWSKELFAAALRKMPNASETVSNWKPRSDCAAFLMKHRDGLRSSVIMADGLAGHFACAFKLKDRAEPVATWFKLQNGPPYGHFAYLMYAFNQMIHSGNVPYPVERTLLTTGVLDRVMRSLANKGRTVATPELAIAYQTVGWPFANRNDSPMQLPND